MPFCYFFLLIQHDQLILNNVKHKMYCSVQEQKGGCEQEEATDYITDDSASQAVIIHKGNTPSSHYRRQRFNKLKRDKVFKQDRDKSRNNNAGACSSSHLHQGVSRQQKSSGHNLLHRRSVVFDDNDLDNKAE